VNDSKPSARNLLAASVLFGVLGKTLYREPEREELNCLLAERIFVEVPFGGAQADSIRGVATLNSWTEANADGLSQDSIDAIHHDFFYLFAGVGRPLASPWESVYFNEGRLMFEKQTLEVRDWYRRFDVMIELKNREPDDHIGYQLSFIAHLAQRAFEAADAGDFADYERILRSLKDFLTEHLLRWAFVWSIRVQENARSRFYSGIALLVSGSLKTLAAELAINMAREDYGRIGQ
jgi:TorA maturation chaperone TorD